MKNFDTLKTLTRTMQSFVAMMLVTLMAVGSVVAQTTYSHTITVKTWSALGEQSLNGVNWTATGTATDGGYFGYDNTKGQQFGSGSKPFSALTLTTSEIAGTITSVKVNTSGANSVNATFKVKVGDTYFTSGEADHIAVTNTATDYTFTGSASGAVALEWAQTSSKALYIKSIEVTYTPAGVAVAAPTFAPGAGLYYTAQNVAISCETADAIIHYTLDGTAPTAQSPIYSAPIAVNTTTTIKAIAVKGTDSSTVASATYTFPIEVANIAAFKAANTATNNTVYKITGDVTFVFKNGANIYVQDTTGGLLIYDQGTSVITRTYTEGDVISGGVYGSCTLYYGLVELIPTRDLAASTINTGAVAPIVATVADIKANYAQFESKLVKISDVTFAGGSFNTSSATNINVEQDGETMQVRNVYKTLSMTIPAGFKANVTGFVLRYNNNFQLAPRANEDVQFGAVTLPYVVDFDQNVDPGFVIANGNNTDKWYIGQAQGFDNNKLYISSNNGVTNKYDVNAYSDVLAYRDVIIPENGAVLNFDSRTMGENGDVLVVYIYNYSADEYYTIFWEYDEPEWNHINMPISPEYAGPGQLVFRWVNNGNGQGEQFPIAIDNISLTEAVCAQPIALNVTVNDAIAVVTWTAADTTQNAWTLEYKLEDHNEWYSVNTTTPTATLSDLQGSSNYNVRVKANCGAESSEWTYTSFQVGCLNAVTTSDDTTITIGTGTSTTYTVPFNALYGYSFTEQIYTADRINAAGLIKAIRFYHKPSGTTTDQTNDIVLYMKSVDRQQFASNTDYEAVSESDIVYSGSWTIPGTEGWTTINLTRPFNYDGNSNLMIAMDENTDGYSTRYFACTAVTSSGISYYSDSANPDPYNLGSYTGSKYVRDNSANIQFDITMEITDCGDQIACAAPTAVTVTDVTENSAVITWSGNATDYTFEYKTGDDDWTVVPVSDTTYTLTGLTQKTDYLVRVKAICGENNNSLYTEEVPFTTLSICPIVTDIETSNLSTTTSISWIPGSNENEWNLRFRPVGSNEWVNLHISGIASTTFGGLQDQSDYEVEIMALCDPTDEDNQSSWAHYEFTSGCAPFELPFEEGFASTTRPDCWESNGITFNGTVAVADSAAEWLMTPPVQIPADNNTYIVVDMQGAASLMASYRGTQMNRFTEIATLGNDETGHYIIEVPASLRDKAVNFMFLASENFSIDNVEFTQCAFVPVNLTAANPLNNAVELTWNGINNNGWVVEFAKVGTDSWTSVFIDQTTDTVTYTLTGLEGSTSYKFRVRTTCAGGFTSKPSNEATVTTRCDAVAVPYEDFDGITSTLDCWTPFFTGTSNRSYVDETPAGKLQMYNYYNRTLDSTDNTALGDLYAILPTMDTALSALQINFTAETFLSSDPDVVFQLGVVTDINRPAQTFRQLGTDYTAVYSPASYTYILNNVDYAGNLAFRVKKSNETKDLRLSNIKVENIPACQKPRNLVAVPLTETSMELRWNKIGTQPRWEIKYMKVYSEYSDFDPDNSGTLVNANSSPRTISNLEYGAWYVFYMRTKCGEGEYSDGWVGPVKKQLVLDFNLANAADITGCNGNIVFEPDTAGTNTLIVRPASDDSWIKLTGNVQLGSAMLKVYDGTAVDESKLLAIYTGSTMVDMTPLCANELTLQLTNVGTTTPVVNLAFTCEPVPTCSAPNTPVFDLETLTLTWEAGCWGTPESYNVYMVDETAGGTVTPLTATTNSLVINSMLNDHETYFVVYPVCDGEEGMIGVASEIYVKIACSAPRTVTALYNEDSQTATIVWTPAYSTQRNFVVEYKLRNAYSWITANVSNTNSFTTSVLDENQTYDVRVKTICADAESDYIYTNVITPCVHSAQGTYELSIGDGTTIYDYLPFYGLYGYTYSQQIFDASELGNVPATISSISFDCSQAPSAAKTGNIRIWLGHTTKSTFSTTSDYVSPSELTEVMVQSGQFAYQTGWNKFTFDTPFEYNGRDNLVVAYYEGMNGYNTSKFITHTASGTKSIYHYHDNQSNVSYSNPPASGGYNGITSDRNNVIFDAFGIICSPVVSCPAPTNLELAKVDVDYAKVSWNRGGSETSWTVVYTLNDGQEVTATATDTFYTITGLEATTEYELNVSVYANCDLTHQSEGISEEFEFFTPSCQNASVVTFTGTGTSQYLPDYTYYDYSYTQQIYLASEINVPAGGEIGSIMLTVASGSATRNWDVYLMHTTETTVSSWLPIGNATLVYSGNITLAPGNLNIEFSSPFEYNGTDNLVLIVDDNTGNYVSAPSFATHTAHSSCSRYVYRDGTNFNPASISGGTLTSSRSNMQFVVCPPPACSSPTNLAFNIETNTLTWKAGSQGIPESYILEYRESGAEDYTTLSTSITDTFYIFAADVFAFNTTYDIRVKANCGTVDGESRWSEYSFSMPECANPCIYYVVMEDSYGDGWNGNAVEVYKNGVLTESLTIANGDSGYATVEVCNGAEFKWKTGSYPDEASFAIYGPDMNLVYYCSDGSSLSTGQLVYTAPMCEVVTCSVPVNFTISFEPDIVLSWSAGVNGTPESYTLQYREAGTENFTTVTVTDTFYQFNNLPENSTYEFQVQANCGTQDGLSTFTPLMSFTTPCGVFDIPYLQDFEGNPICWTEEYVSGTHDWVITQNSTYGSGSYDVAFRHTTTGTKTKLITPTFDLSSNRPVQIRFKHSQCVWGTDQDELRVYYRPSANAAWVMLTEYTENISSMREETIILPAQALTSTCQITFEALDKYGYGVFIDDFVVEYVPTCFVPNTVSVSDVTYNSAKVTWTDPKHQQNFAIEYKTEDDAEWSTVAGDTTLTVNLTDLQSFANYAVRVKAVCGEGDESEYTNEVYFTTPCMGGDFYVAGTGTSYSSNYYTPYYYSGNNSYAEMLYKASEINQNGMINSIAFDCATPGSMTIDTLRIYVATTQKTSLSASTTDWTPMEEMTLVYEGTNVTVGTETGWETYAFNTPIYYNGEDNLLVAVSKKGTSYNSSLKYNATSISSSVHYLYNNSIPTSSGSTSSYRSNAKFLICPPDYDLAVDSIAPIADACDLSDAKVVVKLKNNSYLNAVNGFTVSYTLNGAETPVTETVNATILSGETYVHTFATTPAFVDGSNNILVSVVCDGDEVEDNNTISLLDVRQVVPATVPYEQDFSNVVLGRDAWTQGTENNNPNLWTNNNGVLTFVDSDTIDAQNYVISHCIEIPAGQMQVSYDYNALSNMPENMNVYMGTTPDIASMTLIGSHTNFTKAVDGHTYNYLFNNANAGIYYFAIEATSVKGNMGVTFDNLAIMPMIDVNVIAGPNGTVTPNGTVKVPYNGDLTINIIPNDMYHTAGVWVDSVRVMNEDPYNASFMMYTLENITEPHTIEVRFKMEFHINKYAYNYSDQYAEVGGRFEPAEADTLLDPSGHVLTMIADEHYSLHSLVVGIIPPASEGAIIDGDNVIANVTYDEATRTYTYTFDTLYVSNYYVQACFKKDTVAINYATLTGIGVYDGVSVAAGETHNTWVDYGNDFTSTIQPAAGYYNMGVTVNGVDKGIIDHYDFDSLITTQYVTAQFGHKVTASIMNFNNNEYLGSDEVRGTIEPADTMILSGSSCTVTGTIQEHFHLSNFFVNGEDKLADVNVNGLNFTYTIDSLVANTDIVAVVRIDTIAIYYTVNGGNGYVNGNLMEAPATDTIYVEYGSDFMSQFAAATGYHIVNVTVNGTVYGEIPSWLTEYITAPQNIAATFALNEYDITTAAHGNGSVTPGMHVVYDPQSSYTFTATPAEGYHISQILRNNENLVIADPEAAFTDVIAPVLNDYSYVAYFEPNIYTVTASCGANGTIDPYGAQNYEYGMTPTFTVTANTGYAIEHVYVDGEEVTLTNGTYTFAALTANHTISATFTEDTHTITATADNGGSIDPDGANVVMTGSTVVYTITPATGYDIADVTVDNVSVGAVATYTFENVTADHTIAATFSAQQFTITATAGNNGTITPSGVQTVAYGATPTFTVTADAGYEIDEVRVDGQVVTLTNGAYTFAAVAANHEIFAAFKVKSYTITVTDPNNGTITPNGVITVNHGATPTFTVTPATGYDVTAITVNGSNVIADAQATVMGAYTYTFPAVTANRTLTATMTKKHFTITATAGANGTINGPATVEYGDNATYTITPATGYEIANVTVDGMSVGAVATYTFHNVTANHTINATFRVEPCVVPSNLQTINIDSTSATLTWYHPGADSYDIQYRAANANTWTVVSNVPGFSYSLTNLQTSTTYVWRIKANTVGCTDADWSNATSFTTLAGPTPGVGVADYVKSHVNVYAEHNRVHIINNYNVDINNVSIYDMYGKLIYSGNAINNPEVIELNVAVGTYVVRLNTQQGPAVYKVHINR